jgi:serine/threonine protein kinase
MITKITEDDIVDHKYLVEGICSTDGGMGVLLFVQALESPLECRLVLKYCRDEADEQLKRFRREVRLLSTFKGNSKVAQLCDFNVDYDPPYYVMPYYEQGDLSKKIDALSDDLEAQEKTILQMIECLEELHSRNEFHRDIKPQNFLSDDGNIVVSDFGLTTEIGSDTAFTRSSISRGTPGYIPPEFFRHGGFKHADATSDIFMLGKTIYVLLTKREPTYLMGDDVPPPMFHVIERCCTIDKAQRYQDLAELKQAVVAAFDVLLSRGGSLGKAKQQLSAINDRLKQERKYSSTEVGDFVEQLAVLDEADQIRLCFELPNRFFSVMRQITKILPTFLSIYEKLVESKYYSWSYAEIIANNMRKVFHGEEVPNSQKAFALELALLAATYMRRFAAMDTCRAMVTGIADEALGLVVATLITKHKDTFISEIEPSECNSDAVRNALQQLQAK